MDMVTPRLTRSASVFKKMRSPKKVFAMITAALTFLTFARIVVCLVEAYSHVRAERLADAGLMKTCENGGGAELSPDFRALCLKKRSEQAAPIVLKAVLRAVVVAFTEFCEVFSSPSRIILLVFFSITGIAAPVIKALCKVCVHNLQSRRLRNAQKYATSDSESDSDDERGKHFQIVNMGPREDIGPRQRMQLQLRRSLRRVTGVGSPAMLEDY